MALIKCAECGKEMSDSAKMCPHCGFKKENNDKKENSINKMVCPDCGEEYEFILIVVQNVDMILRKKIMRVKAQV